MNQIGIIDAAAESVAKETVLVCLISVGQA